MSKSPPIPLPVVSNETLDKALLAVADLLIEEEFSNIILNRGKHLRFNTVEHVAYFAEIQPGTEQVDSPVLDIFGQVLHKKSNFECECPKCHRTLAAARFAPHLEKCMGMGRNSSRIASRRLAASACNSSGSSNSSLASSSTEAIRSSTTGSNSATIVGAQAASISEVVSEDEHFEDDVDDDEDWTMDRKKKKKGVDKSTPKRVK